MYKKKSSFSLLEILISISIAGILFGVLFSKFREFASLRKEIKQVEMECLERQHCEIRLYSLFGLLPINEDENSSSLYTKQKNLCFKIHQPIDADPAFIGILDCLIEFQADIGHLCLTLKNSSGLERQEILGKKILHCKMRFFSAKEGVWLEEWPEKTPELPAFLSILCKKSFGEIDYLFPIHITSPSPIP